MRSDHIRKQADHFATGIAQKTVSLKVLRAFAIPLPPLETQRRIVSEIEAERRLVESNRELIERMEQKIAATLARIWGEPPEPDTEDAEQPTAIEADSEKVTS